MGTNIYGNNINAAVRQCIREKYSSRISLI